LLICAGEASGDLLAAELAACLSEHAYDLTTVGVGGPALRQAGMEVLVPAEELAVVGIAEVVGRLSTYRRALRTVRAALTGVDAVLLVDFPDFNLRVAAMARGLGIPVIYYVSPQVWAWRRGRIRTIARRVDRMLTLLPFEPELFRAEGLEAICVGHPLVDRVREVAGNAAPPDDDIPRIALMPGSRPSEIAALWPAFVDTAREVARQVPDTRFEVPLASTLSSDQLPVPDDLDLRVVDEPAAAVLTRARAALVASGTATLEAALCRTPHAVAYRVAPLTWVLGRLLVRGVDHIAMSNLLAVRGGGAPVAPEFLQRLDPVAMAAPLVGWLRDEDSRQTVAQQLAAVGESLGGGGAADRAAAEVSAVLDEPRTRPRGVSRRDLATVLGLAAALVVARVVLGLLHPLHPDEAYFWRWSLDPAWGWFDQPPMVGWMIMASRALLGDGVAAVRLPAALCSAGALVFVYLAVREHAGHRRGLAAAGLLLATPLLGVGGLVTTPDAPLSLAWCLLLYLATRAFAPARGREPPADRWLVPWAGLGLALGLGLLSKVTMLVGPACLGLWWLLRTRRPLGGPLLAGVVVVALLAPWLAWNAAHGWAPFVWELSHGLQPQSGSPLGRFGAFLGGQLGIAGPAMVLAAFALWGLALRSASKPAARLWTALSAPVFLAFGAASLLAPSAANWPAMAWPAVACGLAAFASRRVLWLVGGTGALLTTVALAHLVHPLPLVQPRHDPLADMQGYAPLAEAIAAEVGEGTVAMSRYQDAASVARHLDDPRAVVDLAGRGRPNQWDLWPASDPAPSLFVSLDDTPDAPCEPFRHHEVTWRGEVVRTYAFYRCLPPQDEQAWQRPGTGGGPH